MAGTAFQFRRSCKRRWDHDREALLRDDEQEAAALAETRRLQKIRRDGYLKTLTLDSLVGREWFSSWGDADEVPHAEACRSLLAHLVNELRAADKLSRSRTRQLLKESVKAVNRLDAEQHCIATLERDDLIDAYECAARFPRLVDDVDRWRDW